MINSTLDNSQKVNTKAHINYEALNEFRSAFEEAQKKVTNAIEAKVDAIVGDDTGKSARTIAAEELSRQLIPENAKEALDTLEELAAWFQSHPHDVTEIKLAIERLNAIVENIPYSVDDDGNKIVTADKGYFKELKANTVNSDDKSTNVATTEFVKKAIAKMMFI